MADNSIDLVVSKVAFDQLERLLNEIKLADAAITALNVNAGKAQATPSGAEGNSAANAALIAQMKSLTAEIDKQAAQIQKLSEAKKTYSRAVTQESVDITLRNQKAREAFKATSDEIDNYQRLDAAYKKAVKSAQDLGAQYGANSKQFLTAANAAKELDTKLKAIDSAVGKYGRNVGNYASGWNGLANSVNQLTREAPAFANSLNTGFMALSNNIPILVDEINNVKIKNQELAASGKPTQSVFKSLTSALFSWQTALSVGVTLLTMYGAELYDLAFGASVAEKAQLKLKDSLVDLETAVSSEGVELKSLTEIVLDHNSSSKDRQNAYLLIKEELPGLTALTYEEAVATGELTKATNLQIEAIKNRALVDGYAKLIAEEQIKLEKSRTESLEKQIKWTDRLKDWILFRNASGAFSGTKRILEENKAAQDNIDLLSKKLTETQKNLSAEERLLKKYTTKPKDRKKAEEDALKAVYNARRSEIEKQIQLNEEKLNNEELFIIERLALLDNDKNLRYQLAKVDYDEHYRLAKGNHYKQLEAENDLVKGKSKVNEDYNKKQLDLIKKQLSVIDKLAKSVSETDPNKVLAESAKKAAKELYKMGEQLDKNRESIEASKQAMRDYAKTFLDEFAGKSGLSETFKLFSGDGSLFARMAEGMAFTKDSWKTDTIAMMEGVQEMYNFISNASQENFDAEYERLSNQKEIAMTFAGESASAKQKVEDDYEKRRKEIANRENQAKKKQAMFNVAMDTAQAIISIWAQVPKVDFGVSATALSIMVGALGAAQIGMIAAQKIPQYFEGTDNHPGGLALINDGNGANYKETVVTPDGKVRQYSGRDVLIDAPAGTQVFTHDQWNNELNTMMRDKGISMSNSFNSKSGLSYAEMDSIIAKHFSKITTQSTTIDKNGFNTFVSKGNSRTIRNQSRYSGTGFSV